MNWVWISQISKFMILHSNAVLRTLAPLESLNSSIWEIWKKSTLWQDKINFCYNFLFFRKNHKNYLHSNNQYAMIRSVIHNSSQTKCPDSSVGRAEDWKSSCRWFDSGSGHFLFSFFAHGWLEKAWAFFIFYYLFSFFAHGWLEKAWAFFYFIF